jgi:triosephosphate isomerase
VLQKQLEIGLNGITDKQSNNIVIAYEPVWAIGTGISAENDQIEDAHRFIRNYLN